MSLIITHTHIPNSHRRRRRYRCFSPLPSTLTHTHIPNSHRRRRRCFSPLTSTLTFPPSFEFNSTNRARNFQRFAVLRRNLGFQQLWKFERNSNSPWCCGCKQAEGDAELESEIMEFMAQSEKPMMFPTKNDLIEAGRIDLVEAIKEKGGWYSLGWDDADDDAEKGTDFDVEEFHRRVKDCTESASLREEFLSEVNSKSNLGNLDSDSPQSTASTSLESSAHEDTGIEGILSRLEKQRNSDFGINIEGNGYKTHGGNKDEVEDGCFDASFDVGGNGKLRLRGVHASGGKSSTDMEQETWRTWSNRRAGTQYAEFEAAEISFGKNQVEIDEGTYRDRIAETTEESAQDWYKHENTNNGQIRTRLQHLESELTSALHSLRSKREQCRLEEATGSSSDLQKLSDAVEFQENEFMTAKERLRLIRAKLVVLEGKMALAVNDAQRLVELKQKRMDDAHKALQLLRTTSIVWPNLASEVFLAGSFDGWTTQIKMEKSKTGIFSVSLKLYPGQYELQLHADQVHCRWRMEGRSSAPYCQQ